MNNTVKAITIGGIVTTTLMMNSYMVNADQLTYNCETGTITDQYCSYNVEETKEVYAPQIIIRVGEYEGKPGKRAYITPGEINIPNDIPISYDENGAFIQEFHINKKLANTIYKKLIERGINAELQMSNGRKEDLNAAGRKARDTGAKMYLSIHHNSFKEDSSGMFFMCNEGEYEDALVAQRLSKSVKDSSVPMLDNRLNSRGYIGELNETSDMINILGEFGFFSNPSELEKIMSDEQVEYVAEHLADEIVSILQED